MRVSPSLPLRGIGLVALATLTSGVQAQQVRRTEVRPTEQLHLQPTTISVSELLQLQSTLPPEQRVNELQARTMIEFPVVDLGAPRAHAKPTGSLLDPVNELLGMCSVDLTSGGGFASQGDTPDGTMTVFIPPDVAGAVGPDHLMTMLLNQVLIQDRLGNAIMSMDPAVFWSPVSGTAINYPRVSFDATSNRFIASARSGTGGTMNLLLAVSQTDDPTGTWDYYAIPADGSGTTFPDWVPHGYNQTWITLTANMFNVAGGTFAGPKAWVADKSTIGGPLTVSVFPTGFTAATHGNGGSSTMPSRAMDTTDPNMYLVNDSFSSSGTFLLQFTVISGTGAAPVASGLPGSPFGGSNSLFFVGTNFSGTQRTMPQVGDARFISPFSVRVASVAQRNGKLWVVNSGGLPGPSSNGSPTHTGVIWHQADPALAPLTPIVQSGAIMGANAGSTAICPSVAVNCGDDVLIGYSFGDATRNPEAAYSARLGTDPANSMGPITLLKAGESSYWKNFGVGSTAQWGLYSSAAVDPNDDTTMWTLVEYAAQRVGPADNDSRWGTWWGRVGECGEPTITDQPDPVTACQGDMVVFSVAATASNAGLEYQWRKDGADLPGETGTSYTIAAAVAGDGGVYDVVVRDGCGEVVSDPALLDFAGAIFLQQPVDVHAALFTPASFMVVVSGTGTINYQWRFNGNPIMGANSDTYSIASVTGADYGTYDCLVTDDCGPVLSDSADLKLALKPNNVSQAELSFHIFEQPQSMAGCLGGDVTFEIVAYPEGVTYEWRKNGSPIVPAETGSTLTLTGLDGSEAGSYDCVVTYGMDTKTSSTASLVVDAIPVITDQPDSVDANLGDTVVFSVTATGVGPLHYQWEKKSNPFVPFQPIAGANGPTLIYESVRNGNSGSYHCVVSNHCGGVTSDTAILSIIF